MSFILDALKKSETERQRADAPALYEVKLAPARRGVAVWLIVLAALLLINVVVLSVVLLRGTHSAAPQAEAGAAATESVAPAANPPTTPAAVTPPPAAIAPAAAAPASQAADTSAAAAPAADDDSPAVEPPSGRAGGTADLPTYEQAAGTPGADLPELKLDLNAYASNPADRFILLNMLNLKEGQTSPAGVRVESITPDGAILSWRGSKFFLHSQ